MTIQAVLFDLDNTLYPASSGLMQALDVRILEYVRELLGLELEEARTLRQEYFATYGTTLRGLQLHHTVDVEHYLTNIHDLAFEAFLSSDAELDHLLGQVTAELAIFTNSTTEHAQGVLRQLGIEHHFRQVFDIRFQQFLPKPHPEGYMRVLDALGVEAQHVLMVEDTLSNLVTARSLGMQTILIGPSGGPEADGAPTRVPDVLAAVRLILDLLSSTQSR
jgi:putative hydrolase of the HAD superfamily